MAKKGPEAELLAEISAIGDTPFVQDLRPAGADSFNVIPKLNTFAELTSWAGVTINQSRGWVAASAGQLVWRVVGFYIRDGAATFIPKFQKEDGSPAADIAVVHSWPGAPGLPSNVSVLPDYTNRIGVVGLTNANGDIGFGYSGGMAYQGSKPFNGAGIIWPLCPGHLPEPKFSDAAFGLGWFGGTDHTTVNPIWRLVRKDSAAPPPSLPAGSTFSLALYQAGVDMGMRIAFVNSPGASGWELVLLDENNQVLGRRPFAG